MNVTIDEISKNTKIPNDELNKLCTNKINEVRIGTLFKLCNYLSVSINEIISYEFLRIDLSSLKNISENLYEMNVASQKCISKLLIKILKKDNNQLIIYIPQELYESISSFSPSNISNWLIDNVAYPFQKIFSIKLDEVLIISYNKNKLQHYYLKCCNDYEDFLNIDK